MPKINIEELQPAVSDKGVAVSVLGAGESIRVDTTTNMAKEYVEKMAVIPLSDYDWRSLFLGLYLLVAVALVLFVLRAACRTAYRNELARRRRQQQRKNE